MNIWYIINRVAHLVRIIRAQLYNVKPNISIGKGTIFESRVVVRTLAGGSIKIGRNCSISEGAQILTWGGDIVIGDNSTVNPCAIIYGQGGTIIGKGVRIAAHVVIVPSNHIYSDPDKYIYTQGLSKKGIIIEDDVWLGAGVKVLDGVTISRGCVVGANAVVTKNTEPFGVYVGIPAKKIKSRNSVYK